MPRDKHKLKKKINPKDVKKAIKKRSKLVDQVISGGGK